MAFRSQLRFPTCKAVQATACLAEGGQLNSVKDTGSQTGSVFFRVLSW